MTFVPSYTSGNRVKDYTTTLISAMNFLPLQTRPYA